MEPFIGQIMPIGFTFAPRGWAFCNGQLLPIAQNQALFSLLGTTYGGDGRTTFALPDLRGRVPINSGGNSTGPGLSPRPLGQKSGAETNTLTTAQMPNHNHSFAASSAVGDTFLATGNALAKKAFDVTTGQPSAKLEIYTASGTMTEIMNSSTIGNTGSNQAVNNMQPYLAINYIIALTGIFPSRS